MMYDLHTFSCFLPLLGTSRNVDITVVLRFTLLRQFL